MKSEDLRHNVCDAIDDLDNDVIGTLEIADAAIRVVLEAAAAEVWAYRKEIMAREDDYAEKQQRLKPDRAKSIAVDFAHEKILALLPQDKQEDAA